MKNLIKILILLVVLAVIGTAAFLFINEKFLKEPAAPVSATSDLLVEAENYYRQNPLQYDQAIERFQAIILEAPGSEDALQAERSIQEIQSQKEQAVDRAWSNLQEQASQLVTEGERQAAYDLLNDYDGDFAAELSDRLNTMKQDLRQAINAERKKAEEQQQIAEEALTALIEQTVDLLRDSRFEEVNVTLENAASDSQYEPVQDQLSAFIAETADITALPEMICLNLKSPTNGISQIYLKSGKEPLRIKAVNGLQVMADKIIVINGAEAGSTPMNFTFSDLSLKEQARRLGDSQEPAYNIMRALMLIQGGKKQTAVKYLEKADTPLAQMIADSISVQEKKTKSHEVPADFEPVFEPDADNILIIL